MFLTILVVSVGLLFFIWQGIRQQAALRAYWDRGCTGRQWKRRFPNSSKSEIREFLDTFVEAFGFPQKRRCSFSPDDRMMDVYRALYPPGSLGDSMELESFALSLQDRYKIDLSTTQDDITLGDLYARIKRRSA